MAVVLKAARTTATEGAVVERRHMREAWVRDAIFSGGIERVGGARASEKLEVRGVRSFCYVDADTMMLCRKF